MENYDVVILGGATTGSYFAKKMAERGHRVLVIEKATEDHVGSKYDIFHIAKPDFLRFGLPEPVEGEDKAFEFTGSVSLSAFGHYPKPGGGTTIGMHMHRYTLRLNQWAKAAGAVFIYNAVFKKFIVESGRIAGIQYLENNTLHSVSARLIADCSGIASVGRTNLPDGYGIEKFKIGPEDMFYVTLRYVTYRNEADYIKQGRSWTFYKTWEAPQADPHGAILGVGANLSFETGEKVFAEFEKAISLPEYDLHYQEKGTTPYRRPPYSFVADGFVVMGDAACLTKPNAGEGVTSSMVQADVVVEVVDPLLKTNELLTQERLWPINRLYIERQGKTFAGMLATLIGAVSSSAQENEFFFRHDIIFSAKALGGIAEGKPLQYSTKEMIAMGFKMVYGLILGKVRFKTIKTLLNSMKNGDLITQLYDRYPESPKELAVWIEKADAAWKQCGSMADLVKE
jgi:electron-transferring-flavoprotein dehydrogenase